MYVIVENCQEENMNRNDLYFLFNYVDSWINGCWCYENPSEIRKFALHDLEFSSWVEKHKPHVFRSYEYLNLT